MKLWLTILTVVALVVPTVSFATNNWTSCTDSTKQVTYLSSKGNDACVVLTTAGDEISSMLEVAQCDHFDVLFNSDTDSLTPGGTTSLNVYHCLEATISEKHCQILLNETLSGVANDDGIWGGGARWIYVEGTVDPGATVPRAQVICH